MPDWREVQADPDYQALVRSDPERARQLRLDYLKVHITSDPDFQKLAPERRTALVREFVHGGEQGDAAPLDTAKSATRAFVEGAADVLDPTPLLKSILSPTEAARNILAKARAATGRGDDTGRPMVEGLPLLGPLLEAQRGQAEMAQQALQEGRTSEGIGRLGAAALPFAGPAAAHTGETFGRGEYARGAGQLAAIFGPDLIRRLASRVRLPKAQSFLEPREQAAVQFAASRGIPVDLAQATGNPTLEGFKSSVSRLPFAGPVVKRAGMNQQRIMAEVAASLANDIIPFNLAKPTPLELGEAVRGNVVTQGENYRGRASKAHNDLIALADASPKKVQTGTETKTVGASTGIYGEPIPGTQVTVPIYEDIAGPVNYAGVKVAVAPVLEQLEAILPVSEKAQSPGITLLRQLAARKDTVPLEIALDDLSELKSKARSLPGFDRTKSQGKAAFGVGVLQDAVGQALDALGPEGRKLFEERNRATVLKKAAAAVGRTLTDEPARNVRYLLAPGDANALTLTKAVEGNADLPRQLGRQWFEDQVAQASDKGMVGWRTVNQRFKKLGDETKGIVFGDKTGEIGDFLEFAEITQRNPNPSNTSVVGHLIGAGMFLLKNPATGTAYLLGSKQIAKLLYSQDGAKMLNTARRIPLSSPDSRVLAEGILANAGLRDAGDPVVEH